MKILTPKLFKFPLNSIKESEKIHEALSINFFISSSRTDKTEKKKIKLSGFAFLNYLFDHPYFVYNNYVPSWQRSSFFPASVFFESFDTKPNNSAFSSLKKSLEVEKNRTSISFTNQNHKVFGFPSSIKNPYKVFNYCGPTKGTRNDNLNKGSLPIYKYNALVLQNRLLRFRSYQLLNKDINTELLASFVYHNEPKMHPFWLEASNRKTHAFLYRNSQEIKPSEHMDKLIRDKENYPPYFTTSSTLLKTLTWRFLKKTKHTRFSKIWPLLKQESLLKINSFLSDPRLESKKSILLFKNKIDGSFLARCFLRNSFRRKHGHAPFIKMKEAKKNKWQIKSLKNMQTALQAPVFSNMIKHGRVSFLSYKKEMLVGGSPFSYRRLFGLILKPNRYLSSSLKGRGYSINASKTLAFEAFGIRNTIKSDNVGNLNIQEKTDNINHEKVSIIQNNYSRKWVKTPVITNRAPSIRLTAYKNMYDKYLSALKNSLTIQNENSLSYNNNLRVLQNQYDSRDTELEKQSHAFFNPNSKQSWTNEFFPNKGSDLRLFRSSKKQWPGAFSSNRLLTSLVSILNTTNFRDVLFERFMNAKFYDIGLMGRKRLNKKLRLNVPLQCTTLTPLDFLAIFYKLFSLYNNFSLIQNFFPTESRTPLKIPFLGDSFAKVNPWSNLKSEIHSSSGSIEFRQLMSINIKGATLPLAIPGVGNIFKPRNNLLNSTLKQTGSLDHLNQRHIRTSGEFLFLQFWRAILRFYQVLSQLSSRSNFIKSSYTAAGKTGRNFFSLSSISLFPSIESNISDQTEYILPLSNNQTHVFKAYGYFNPPNSSDNSFNFNSVRFVSI